MDGDFVGPLMLQEPEMPADMDEWTQDQWRAFGRWHNDSLEQNRRDMDAGRWPQTSRITACGRCRWEGERLHPSRMRPCPECGHWEMWAFVEQDDQGRRIFEPW